MNWWDKERNTGKVDDGEYYKSNLPFIVGFWVILIIICIIIAISK